MDFQTKTRRYFKYPVTKNGIYEDKQHGRLEYWFVFKGRKAKIGECKLTALDGEKLAWEVSVREQMQQLLTTHFGIPTASLTVPKRFGSN